MTTPRQQRWMAAVNPGLLRSLRRPLLWHRPHGVPFLVEVLGRRELVDGLLPLAQDWLQRWEPALRYPGTDTPLVQGRWMATPQGSPMTAHPTAQATPTKAMTSSGAPPRR